MKNRILFFAILAVFFAATEARPQSPPEITWLTPSTQVQTQDQSLASFAVIRETGNQSQTLDNIAAFTNNDPPDAMGFIVPGLRPLSEMEGKQALAMAFTRNPAGRGYWNDKIHYDVINRELYLTIMRNRGKSTPPTDEQVKQAIMDMTIGDAPANFSSVYAVEMVDKATGAIKYGKREPYPGEKFLFYKGEPIISLTCLNFTPRQTSVVVTPGIATVPTTWDEYTLLSNGQPAGQTGLTVVNNNTNLIPASYGQQQQQQNNGGCNHGGCNHGCSSHSQQTVVAAKTKPNFWEVAAGVTGIVNVGLNLWDLLNERNGRAVGFQQFNQQGFNGFVNPGQPFVPNQNGLFQGGIAAGPGFNLGSTGFTGGTYVTPTYSTPTTGWTNGTVATTGGNNSWVGY